MKTILRMNISNIGDEVFGDTKAIVGFWGLIFVCDHKLLKFLGINAGLDKYCALKYFK
ncbi:hypothetical protein MTBBW1_1910006 [Desulfamplus magnetovallimortis]|uniref:Uncharacterized protein n=1 Tax=Desulfamplus magnetovallimortis TaxID=1246637 RepID=A0A1W1HB37_9BACT|nr:hypothetical protein MTBBW1_1910006 [Desulfamplus magnetovallimortis]